MSKAARRVNPLRQIVAAVSAVVAECAYAQRRMAEINTAPDRYLFNPDAPPETYAEFLYRTSGLLHHEPSARARARGRARSAR
jgi:hypothetical protein